MAGAERTEIVIELEVGSDPIAGRIKQPSGDGRFVGWLALVRALERAVHRPGGAVDDQ